MIFGTGPYPYSSWYHAKQQRVYSGYCHFRCFLSPEARNWNPSVWRLRVGGAWYWSHPIPNDVFPQASHTLAGASWHGHRAKAEQEEAHRTRKGRLWTTETKTVHGQSTAIRIDSVTIAIRQWGPPPAQQEPVKECAPGAAFFSFGIWLSQYSDSSLSMKASWYLSIPCRAVARCHFPSWRKPLYSLLQSQMLPSKPQCLLR